MAKKKSGVGSNLMAIIVDTFFGSIVPRVKEGAEEIMDNVESRALALQEKVVQRVGLALMNGLAIVFMFLAGFWYLIEFQGMLKTHAYLLLGIVILLITFFLKYQMLKNEKR